MNCHPIEIENLFHSYGKRELYHSLSLTIPKGKVYALLGKNGVGKTSLIQILMGFMRPNGGECRVFGDPAHTIRPKTRERVGLLFERHLAYDFFTIEQAEKFTRSFYKNWKSDLYYGLVDKLGLPYSHRIANMSEGQRSQIVLGLILAQDPELLILDDYSMGLDAGYRRLFIDYLCENLKDGEHTVVITSHVIQDMQNFVDELVFMRKDKPALVTSLDTFMEEFTCYTIVFKNNEGDIRKRLSHINSEIVVNTEWHKEYVQLFFYASSDTIHKELQKLDLHDFGVQKSDMDIEDAFIGYTGRY